LNWFHALLLGLIQGLTEFLPVSSSGHLVIGRNLLGISEGGLTFEIWLHLATLVSVVVALGSDIRSVLRSLIPGTSFPDAQAGRRIALGVVVGTIPAVLVGFFLKDAVEAAFTSVRLVGIDLLVTAVILFISRYFRGGTAQMTPGRSILIGMAQALAILPGISRSGATLTAGLITGLPGVDAVRFSFMLAVPVILGAVVLDLPALAGMGATSPAALVAGFLSASISGYLAIRMVWKVMERGRLAMFAPYCALVGLVVLLWGGTPTP
jgi:undecaprenyl-diphosphatase